MSEGEGEIDAALLDSVKAGDEAAWANLAEILYPQVAGIVRRHLRREADREDVAQEVFLKIFLKISQFAGQSPFEHWVARIALNTCRDWLRRLKVRPLTSYSDLADDQREVIERTLSGEGSDSSEDPRVLRDFLDHVIATLKPREQIVIRLLDLEERSVQDVCDLTGWGVSKVKVTVMRARRKLAKQIRRLENRPDF